VLHTDAPEARDSWVLKVHSDRRPQSPGIPGRLKRVVIRDNKPLLYKFYRTNRNWRWLYSEQFSLRRDTSRNQMEVKRQTSRESSMSWTCIYIAFLKKTCKYIKPTVLEEKLVRFVEWRWEDRCPARLVACGISSLHDTGKSCMMTVHCVYVLG
jgi:hypothetical protein